MSLAGVQLHLVNSFDDAQELMRWLSEVKEPSLAVDTETEGLDKHRDRVRLVQVGDDMHGWAIPFNRWGGLFEDVVRKWPGRFDMHNAPFDWRMLKNEGIDIPQHRIDDTRLLSYTLDPTQSVALKNVATRHVDKQAASMMRNLDQWVGSHGKWTWATVPIVPEGEAAVYWQYGALDPVLTSRVRKLLKPKVDEDAPRAYELQLATEWVTERMEWNGITVDRDFTQRCYDEFTSYVESIERWCVSTYGIKPGANADVVGVLEREGFTFDKATATGAVALDKTVLGPIDHPLAQAVLTRRQVQKIASTYLRRFLEYSDSDGVLHPNINSIGGSGRDQFDSGGYAAVRSTRMSMDSPNFQQLPRPGTTPWGDAVRMCVRASDGGVLLFADFDQIEMRIMGHLSQDVNLRAAFLTDLDFFVAMGQQIYRDSTFIKSDPRRAIVKNSMYAKAYAAGIEKFALTARIGIEEATEFMTMVDALYPGIRRFQESVMSTAYQRLEEDGVPWVRSPMTRQRHVVDQGKEYVLINRLIQGMAAEVFKLKLVELDAAGLGDWLALPVHDEIVINVPAEQEQDATRILREVMNDSSLLSVPITSSIARGQRWGAKEEVR